MYFDKITSEEKIKERYRILAKRLHPDVGGDEIIMKEINNEYEKALTNLKSGYRRCSTCHCRSTVQEYMDPEIVKSEERIDMILRWALNHPEFNTDFVESLRNRLYYKKLTETQEKSLDNIIKKFNIKI